MSADAKTTSAPSAKGGRIGPDPALQQLLDRLLNGESMTGEQSGTLFRKIVAGRVPEIFLAAIVSALRVRGESPVEIAGAAAALRDEALAFPQPDYDYADTCGTGGDGLRTVNISTAAAFVAAELGVPVAKHGNRSVSSQCGSADVLEACGVRLTPEPAVARRCLDEAGVCFLMAPQYHGGLRHAAPVRRTLAARTIFNLLGPLVNPAAPPLQVMGVFAPEFCRPAAETLKLLGTRRALVVHGSGLDEIALHGPTTVAELKDGEVTERTLQPSELGVDPYPLARLRGGTPEENATWLRGLLGGRGDEAHVAAIAANVGALMLVAGKADSLAEGSQMAVEALSGGGALQRLEALAELSRGGSSASPGKGSGTNGGDGS